MMTACITQSQLPGGPMNQLTRCDRLIQIRAPEFLTKALDSAADKQLTSRSDYIRAALLDRLRADGIDPAQLAAG
jgi:Ribbon-helix-helix protein, copG family